MTTKKIPGRTYVSLSFSCPPAMERAINKRAAELGLHSRSDYLRRLFEQDLANAGMYNKFSTAKAPPRITRGRRKKKAEPVPETPDLSNPQKSESASHLP